MISLLGEVKSSHQEKSYLNLAGLMPLYVIQIESEILNFHCFHIFMMTGNQI